MKTTLPRTFAVAPVRRASLGCALAAIFTLAALHERAGAEPAPPITIGAPASPAPEGPKPTSYAATHVVEPLREIGRVKAITQFCKEFVTKAGPAVNSALAFEAVLLQTARDFRHARLGDELARQHSLAALTFDLRMLGGYSNEGRAELATLQTLADDSDQDQHDDILAFRDALDGAKERQMRIARAFARSVGRYAEAPISSLVDTTHDRDASANAFQRGMKNDGSSDLLDITTDSENELYSEQQELFDSISGDEMVEHDLARAADEGKAVIARAHC